jgi:predicted ribosome quality control (RQC) complex YloA/Tae2 family protein
MTLSRAELELILDEIEPLAGRCVIQRVLEADRHTRVLQLREPGNTHHLLLSTQPNFTRIHFVAERPSQPDKPSAFTMQLRKWLQGALFEEVRQLSNDRIVRFELEAVDPSWEPDPDVDHERAPRVRISLVVELTGRHANWFLLDANDTILGQLDAEVLGSRELGRGKRYQPPAPPPNPSVGSRVRWQLDDLAPERFERSKRVDQYYKKSIEERHIEDAQQSLETRLNQRTGRLQRRVKHVEGDLSRAEDAEEYKRRGELLQSAWGKVDRGAAVVTVPDFYDEAMPEVDVPLDPALDLEQNIEQYFHEYHRLEGARGKIEQRLLESMEQLDRAKEAMEELEQYRDDLDAMKAFGERLEADGVLPRQRKQRHQRSRDEERKPYREFRSKHDRPILVGRGASDNDTVSTSVARGRDMWFHTRDWAGAHVLLRMRKNDESPKSDDLLDAATLAAWFSRGKNDTLVDVTYTRAKYVRKPKGFPPGRVTIADASTIGVSIEKKRVDRLLATER